MRETWRRLIAQLLRARAHKTHNFNRQKTVNSINLCRVFLSSMILTGIYCRKHFIVNETVKVVGNCISRMMLSAIVKHDAISINNTRKWVACEVNKNANFTAFFMKWERSFMLSYEARVGRFYFVNIFKRFLTIFYKNK